MEAIVHSAWRRVEEQGEEHFELLVLVWSCLAGKGSFAALHETWCCAEVWRSLERSVQERYVYTEW